MTKLSFYGPLTPKWWCCQKSLPWKHLKPWSRTTLLFPAQSSTALLPSLKVLPIWMDLPRTLSTPVLLLWPQSTAAALPVLTLNQDRPASRPSWATFWLVQASVLLPLFLTTILATTMARTFRRTSASNQRKSPRLVSSTMLSRAIKFFTLRTPLSPNQKSLPAMLETKLIMRLLSSITHSLETARELLMSTLPRSSSVAQTPSALTTSARIPCLLFPLCTICSSWVSCLRASKLTTSLWAPCWATSVSSSRHRLPTTTNILLTPSIDKKRLLSHSSRSAPVSCLTMAPYSLSNSDLEIKRFID